MLYVILSVSEGSFKRQILWLKSQNDKITPSPDFLALTDFRSHRKSTSPLKWEVKQAHILSLSAYHLLTMT